MQRSATAKSSSFLSATLGVDSKLSRLYPETGHTTFGRCEQFCRLLSNPDVFPLTKGDGVGIVLGHAEELDGLLIVLVALEEFGCSLERESSIFRGRKQTLRVVGSEEASRSFTTRSKALNCSVRKARSSALPIIPA